MTRQISDTRIVSSQPLINPWVLAQEIPATDSIAAFIGSARDEIAEILRGNDQRQLVIVGPCSVHDPKALLEFGQRLKEFEASVKDALFLVLR
ncbi:MAG: 3-deoxy-7-phosphoheptulonate synthase, partial [Pseudomonadota bacterium]